jgi:DNA-binding CsgD family transcriptional regulator/tetratricopeptide (TPR) repeat protein
MTPFVGRGRELAELGSAIDELRAGQGGLALLAGEAGIGKTRLASETCAQAVESGAIAVWGRCSELEGMPAYWPWIQVLRRIAEEAGPAALIEALGDAADEITRLVPELGAGRLSGRVRPGEEGSRFRLFDTIARLLHWWAGRRRLVIVLDDLQWSDASSLTLLRYLSPQLPDVGLLIMAIYRTEEIPDDHPLAAALPLLSRERGARLLELRGLSVGEVDRYLAAAHDPVAPELVATIHRRTGGNPFFVTELARLVRDEGPTRPDALPRGVREVIGRRLRTLPDEVRQLLGAASVLGSYFDLDLLAEMAGTRPPSVLGLVDRAVRAELIQPDSDLRGRYVFTHDLVRETLYRELATSVRLRLHRAAAEALGRRPHGDRLAAMAHHWFEVAPGGDWFKAAYYAAQAADQAMTSLAFEDAARLYRMAVEVLAGRPGHETRRCKLLLAQAEAQYRSGDLGLCLESCKAAAGVAGTLGRPDLQARAALVLHGIGTLELAMPMQRLTEDALRAVGEGDPALRARLLGQLAAILEFAGRPERNGLISREALDLAEHSNQPDALVAALHARHAATTGPDGVDERLAVATRLIGVAEDSELGVQALWGRLWRVDAHFQLGELPLLPAELDEIEVLVDRARQPLFLWHVLLNRASLAHVTGAFADAASFATAAFAAGRAEQHRIVESHYRNLLAWIAVETGSPGELEEALAMADRINPLPLAPIVVATVTRFELALGRIESARRRFEQLMSAYARLPKSGTWLAISAHLAEVAAELGTSEQTVTLFRAMAPYHRLFVAPGAGVAVCLGSAARHLGLLAARLGEWREAERYLQEAAEQNSRAGALPFAAHAQVALAEVVARRSDHRLAADLARSAARTAASLGMKPLAECAGRVLKEIRAAGPKLSRREVEVAGAVARGLSNRNIAAALHLSDRTVENHVQHILDKLGFSSRSQIAAWAVSGGIVAGPENEYRG